MSQLPEYYNEFRRDLSQKKGHYAASSILLDQARSEGMLLLTVDASVSQYPESVLAL